MKEPFRPIGLPGNTSFTGEGYIGSGAVPGAGLLTYLGGGEVSGGKHLYYTDTSASLGKYAVHKTHTKLHPGPEWHISHILTSEDIDYIISRFYVVGNGKRVLAIL